MNKVKYSAIVVASLVALSGCGSESKSSTGSNSKPPTPPAPEPTPPPAPEYFNFQFLQLLTTTTASEVAGCTVFSESTSGSTTTYTYGKLASDLTAQINNADGTINRQLTVPSSGYLKVDKTLVPTGGFITVIDSPSETDHYYKALSIQRNLLSNHTINVGRNQGNVQCYSANQSPNTKEGYASVGVLGLTVTGYDYASTQGNSGVVNSTSHEIKALTSEPVLVRAYNNTDLVGYAEVTELTPAAFGSVKQIQALTESVDGSLQTSGHTWNSIGVNLHKSPYNYSWETPSASGSAFTIKSNSDLTFNYRAKGTSSTSWNFTVNGVVGSTLDIQLPDSLSLNDTAPTIQQDALGHSFINGGVSTSGKSLITRAQYNSTVTGSTLTHAIYSVSTNGNTKIPQLNLPNISASNSNSVSTSAFEVATLDLSFARYVMTDTGESASDTVRDLALPNQVVSQENTLRHSNYTKVSR